MNQEHPDDESPSPDSKTVPVGSSPLLTLTSLAIYFPSSSALHPTCSVYAETFPGWPNFQGSKFTNIPLCFSPWIRLVCFFEYLISIQPRLQISSSSWQASLFSQPIWMNVPKYYISIKGGLFQILTLTYWVEGNKLSQRDHIWFPFSWWCGPVRLLAYEKVFATHVKMLYWLDNQIVKLENFGFPG